MLEQAAVVALLGQVHELAAATEAAIEQDFDLKRCPPDVHGAVNHEGAVRHEEHRSALKGGVQNEIEQELDAALDFLAGAELVVLAAFDVEPAEDGPPETGVDAGDAANGALSVVSEELLPLFDKAGGEDAAGLVGAALQLQGDIKEVPNDLVATLQQQVEHHGNVVPQEDLAVVQGFIPSPGVGEGRDGSNELAANPHQGALEMLLGGSNNRFFAGAGSDAKSLLAELLGQDWPPARRLSCQTLEMVWGFVSHGPAA